METLIPIVGVALALILIYRLATKKTKHKGAPAGSGILVTPGPGAAAPSQSQGKATIGTVIGVNVICAIGVAVAVIAAISVGDVFLRWAAAMASLIFFPVIAFKFLESQDRGQTFSLIGALAAFSILFWIGGGFWYTVDIANYVRSVLNG